HLTKGLVERVTTDGVIEMSNRCDIAVQSASFRWVRGFSVPLVLADEVAFWQDADRSLNPASEIMRALQLGMATIPQPLLLSISSPFSKEGGFYEQPQKHWGDNESPALAWKAASMTMNPTLAQDVVDLAYRDDPQAAAAEYGGDFRSDVASFVDR